ncbi:MAG: HEAT repeat domain-containing protein [Roseiflexaceae bacterium]
MFTQDMWRQQISERLGTFARNPRQEMQLAGSPSLLAFLIVQTLDPFLTAFQEDPIHAVLALAEITRESGANQIVRRAARRSYQSAAQIDRELRSSPEMRIATELLLIELQTIAIVRQRLNGSREEWLRTTLERELDGFPGEFTKLRRVVSDPGGQVRLDALRRLRNREGHYSPADLVLIHDSLSDSSAHVRTQAARLLGMIAGPPPALLTKTLVQVALRDCDVETRFAAARAIGMLRESITSPQLLDYLSSYLFDSDRFHRAASALVLGQLGDCAGAPMLVRNLTKLLEDDDIYVREAAACALGRIGPSAATPEVLAALLRATQDSEVQVHEAATDALIALRDLKPTKELELAMSA